MTTLMTVREFCADYKIGRAHLYNLLRQGRGPAITKIGKCTRISREAAEAWRKALELAAGQKAAA